MYFIMICTWEPQDEREVRTRRVTWEWPSDVKVLSEFYDLQGGRTIYVVDTDAKGLLPRRHGSILSGSKSFLFIRSVRRKSS